MSGPRVRVWVIVDNECMGEYWVQQGKEEEQVQEIVNMCELWRGFPFLERKVRWRHRLDAPIMVPATVHWICDLPHE